MEERLRNNDQNSGQRNKENKRKVKRETKQENERIPVSTKDSQSIHEKDEQKVFNKFLNSDSVKQDIEKKEENLNNVKEKKQKDEKSKIDTNSDSNAKSENLSNSESAKSIIIDANSGETDERIEPGYKIIVLWTPIADFAFKGNQAFIDAKCVINKCIFTTNKSFSNKSDAIVFNARHIVRHELTNTDMRSSHQKWIFFSRDSPQYTEAQGLDYMSYLFNWSWTYRSDSDIVNNYGIVEKMRQENNRLFKDSHVFDFWRQKNKMIFWFANNCQTFSKRENYVKDLKSYIDIDIYGKCSEVPNDIDISNERQLKSLSNNYLFVIVFEKSYCKDFVSKRLYDYLEHNIIPIVMGGAHYSTIVPPNSVINVNDFNSTKDLADYVLDIGTDFKKYKTFFEWKRSHRISFERKDFCQLCYKLHEEVDKFKTYIDMKKWWFDDSDCQTWNSTINSLSHN